MLRSIIAAPTNQATSDCRNVTFHIYASAINNIVAPVPDISTFALVNAYYASLKTTLAAGHPKVMGGKFKIAAVYCTPPPQAPRNSSSNYQAPLQILLHGSSYTKEYWDRGAWGTGDLKYSWRAAANAAGYATLAIDKFGNGGSSHPSPTEYVQLPLQMETVHSIVKLVKSGHRRSPIPKHEKLIFVGHSSGSILGADHAQYHPDDFDAFVLTGYPSGGSNQRAGISAQAYLPAALSDPKRFDHLQQGYLLQNNESVHTESFYYKGHFDPSVAHFDYIYRGTVPLGESFTFGALTQPAYRGKVLVVTGSKDPIICGFTPVNQCALNLTNVLQVRKNFGNNTGFDYYIPVSGHALNWHFSAEETYRVVWRKLGRLLGSGEVAGPHVQEGIGGTAEMKG